MFYCEKCRIKKGWPESIMKSNGKCEICGEVAECYDRPSRSLPISSNREIAQQTINMRFFLKGFWQTEWDEVTRKQYITAEKNAGVFSDGITILFNYGGISGKAERVVK